MRKEYYLIISLFTIIFYSCGGTIGNIEKYRFQNITIDSLKSIVEIVNLEHPELRQFDTTMFQEGKSGLGDGDFYCTIRDKKNHQKYCFEYAYVQYSPPHNGFVEIALTYAGKYGEELKIEKDLGFFEKRKYKKLFKEYFIEKVRKKVKQ
jgi:hypothetical protein